MPKHKLPSNIVRRLTKARYGGLLPVASPDAEMSPDSEVTPGKVPSDLGSKGWRGVTGWTEQPYDLRRLDDMIVRHGAGIGQLTTRHPWLDVDVTEPEIAA